MIFAQASAPAVRIALEAAKKTFICAAAAFAIGTALPYSFSFAFETMTYLGFVVALSEGVISVVADLIGFPEQARGMSIESVETLSASVALAVVSIGATIG